MGFRIQMVDAFASAPFKGNQAAVVLMDEPRSDEWMQRVAAEMNLSETAFLEKRDDGFGLRWFTPAVEVPLCGHATLASAHALWDTGVLDAHQTARFHTKSGLLLAKRVDDRIELDFPRMRLEVTTLDDRWREALGLEPINVHCSVDREPKDAYFLIEVATEHDVRSLRPDFATLKLWGASAIVTARAIDKAYDFVSRFFAPAYGVNEDPVTGSAHCALLPYWAERFGRRELVGYQASARSGFVYCQLGDERCYLSGEAVTIVRGELAA